VLSQKVDIKSVVLFPRFLVDEHIEPDLWVLNPMRFTCGYIPKAPQTLSAADIGTILSALRARVKTVNDMELADL
jgi:hypothetical protein